MKSVLLFLSALFITSGLILLIYNNINLPYMDIEVFTSISILGYTNINIIILLGKVIKYNDREIHR